MVAVATAVPDFEDIAGVDQVGDDPERAAFRDPQRRGDVAEARAGVVGDAEKGSRVVGEEAPFGHAN